MAVNPALGATFTLECTCQSADVTSFGDASRRVLQVRDPECPMHRERTPQQQVLLELRARGEWPPPEEKYRFAVYDAAGTYLRDLGDDESAAVRTDVLGQTVVRLPDPGPADHWVEVWRDGEKLAGGRVTT